jgi:gliding motility-associated-like protein
MLRILFFLCCFIPISVFSQTPRLPSPNSVVNGGQVVKDCATDLFIKNQRGYESYKVSEDKMNEEVRQYALRRDSSNGVITLPVVVHIVNLNPSLVSDGSIISAISELNDAYGKTGKYSASVGADTKIRFCLAKKDPNGGISTGITRTTSYFGRSLNPVIEDKRLKNTIQWDPARYINVWYVADMELETVTKFECGKWIRMNGGGYATMPPASPEIDGIVVTAFGSQLVHEMGHYLGLYHTFEGLNCKNNDCTVDGDKVCDTPPDAYLGSSFSCNQPDNSCGTDTLSGFTKDMPDQIANFMDYGNESCHNEFTSGQAQRMVAVINTQRSGLLQDECTAPCVANITAGFTRDIFYPLPGNLINYTNISIGTSRYEWLVNDQLAATSINFSNSFSDTGKYKITLKAYSDSACFATYTNYVIVNCGVTARFYTDKRELAAKAPVYLDTIHFTNTSEGATSYKWIMRNDKGMTEEVIGISKDLTYVFQFPATYYVKLIATNGSCTDSTEEFPIPVTDAEADGVVALHKIECYKQTKLRVTLYVCNRGYTPIPRNTPISFYDSDPRLATAKKIDTTFLLPDAVLGLCCGTAYTITLDVGSRGLNQLYAVFNDSGNTHPLVLPNTMFVEKDYNNNISLAQNVAFKIAPIPPSAVLEWGDTLQLNALSKQDTLATYKWSTPRDISCTNCQTPILIADSSIVKTVIGTSTLGCTDTAYVDIKVPPYNDFSIAINDAQCAGTDSLFVSFTISNAFKRGVLPKTLSVSFYNGDPQTGKATLLPPVITLSDSIRAKQVTINKFIKGMSAGPLYAVVNDSARALPVSFTNLYLPEKNYSNNIDDTLYRPETVQIDPSDTTVFRTTSLPLVIANPIYNPASIAWSNSNDYKLSCYNCAATVITPLNSSLVNVQMENKFGCVIKGAADVKVFPPDMQVQILDTKCYTNTMALVTFKICMNNYYDTVFANIPVSFYDGNPTSGLAHLLQPVYYTTKKVAGGCSTYTARITAPTTNQLVAVVNDKGDNSRTIPSKSYDETDFTNNLDKTVYTPFEVSVFPSDTTVQRLGSVMLTPFAKGGTIRNYLWTPSQFLSCTNCATPVATPRYTMQYQLLARNEYSCTDTALAIVKTQTGQGAYIPDAFTPNGDRLNDVLYVMAGPDVVALKDFSIFNRWGMKVFQVQNVAPNNPLFGWDGRIKGKEAPPESYVYYATVTFINGAQQVYKGTVVLIR